MEKVLGPGVFWAKLETDREGKITSWHSVEDHCADVAACFRVLTEQRIIRERLAGAARLRQLTDGQLARL